MSTIPQGGVATLPTASKQPIFILACCVVSICASTQVFKAVLPLWILERTHDASYMAAVRFVEYVPLFLMFWLFGWLIDNLRSRTLLRGIGVVACLSSWTIFRHDDMPPPAILLLAAGFYAGFYLLHASRIIVTRRVVAPADMALANRVVSVAAQGVVIVGPAIGALAILGSMHLNPAFMVVGLSVIGLVAASRLGDDPPTASMSARSGTMLQAITLWQGDAFLRRTTFLTSGYNFVDAALWFSFYYVAKVQLQLADASLALAMLPGVVGCLAGYRLSRPFSTSPRLGFLAAYLLLGVALLPMVMFSSSVLGIALTVFVLSASNIVHSATLSHYRQTISPHFMEGRLNAWITVVIRVGSLCALASAAWLYRSVPIIVLHACYAGACAVMLGVSCKIYRKQHAAES